MKIKEAFNLAFSALQNRNINSSKLEARLLICLALKCSYEELFIRYYDTLTFCEERRFINLIKRRCKLEPIAYLLKEKEFYSYKFYVNKHVLIPRPETEILVSTALNLIESKLTDLLDLGTGSGCIAISLLLEKNNTQALATDISNKALKVAKKNASLHKVDHRLSLINSYWFHKIEKKKFDIIITNPPYIPIKEKHLVSLETVLYEPYSSLFSKKNGLDAFFLIAKSAKNFLKPEGKILIEFGFNQANIIQWIFKSFGYKINKIYKDFSGHPRVAEISFN